MRKREKRIRKETKRRGTKKSGHGWAARQASKRIGRRGRGKKRGAHFSG